MWKCAKCSAEVDDGFEVCWSCGTTIDGRVDPTFVKGDTEAAIQAVAAAPAEVAVTSAPLVAVAVHVTLERAEIVTRHLEAAGIPVFIADEPAAGGGPVLLAPQETTTLQVRDTDADRARAIVADIPAEPPPPPAPEAPVVEEKLPPAAPPAPPPAQGPAPPTAGPPRPTSPIVASKPGVWEPANKDDLTPMEYVRALEVKLSSIIDANDVPGWKVNPAFAVDVNAFIQSHSSNASFLKKAQSMQQNRAKYFATMRHLASQPKPVEEEKPAAEPGVAVAEPWTGPMPTPRFSGLKRAAGRALRWAMVLLVLGGLLGAIGSITYSQIGDQKLRAAAERIEAKDKEWEWDDLKGKGTAVPALDNAALDVDKAVQALPKSWPKHAELAASLRALDPVYPLTEEEEEAVVEELFDSGAAQVHAQGLVNFQTGLYPPRKVGTVSAVFAAPRVLDLLWLDVANRAHHGKHGQALMSCRAILLAGRAAGDASDPAAQKARRLSQELACSALERALAQGVTEEYDLAATQTLLQDEASRPVLLWYLRGWRAWVNEMMKEGWTGDLAVQLPDDDSGATAPPDRGAIAGAAGWLLKGQAKQVRAAMLELLTDAVDLARLPVEQQAAAIEAWSAKCPGSQGEVLPGVGLDPAARAVREARQFVRSQALLRCAIAAIAAERYRAANERWPATVEELVPQFLPKEFAIDPYDGQPLRLKKLNHGIVINSVGPNDIGFRLWNAEVGIRRTLPLPERIPAPTLVK